MTRVNVMPYDIGWEIPFYLLYVVGIDEITLEEVAAINQEFVDYLESSNIPVHILIDVTRITSVPHNFIQLKNNQTYLDHLNLGWIVFIGADRILTFLATLVSQMTRARLRFFRTEDEARAFLADNVPELFDAR